MRKRVYLAGPISKGDLAHNINQASEAFLALMRAGFAPLCPHWSAFAGGCFYDSGHAVIARAEKLPAGTTHEDWMGVDLPWVEVSDAVLRLPGESVGADIEVAHAHYHDIPVFDSLNDVIAYFNRPPKEDPMPPQSLDQAAHYPPTEYQAEAIRIVDQAGYVPGVGPDAPTVVNEAGGKQSHVPYRADLLPPAALLSIAAVLHEGASKYGPNNWRSIPRADHLNHALVHVLAYLSGDRQDDHLLHAGCRLLFAMETIDETPSDAAANRLRLAI